MKKPMDTWFEETSALYLEALMEDTPDPRTEYSIVKDGKERSVTRAQWLEHTRRALMREIAPGRKLQPMYRRR